MKALVTGAGGQLASELVATPPDGWTVETISEIELDIRDAGAVRAAVMRSSPDLLLNAAAYTAVDRAESEPEIAWAVNRDGAANLARAAVEAGARIAHVSTDFVFDGQASRAYRPEDAPAPLGVYGASKLAGEVAVQEAAPNALILRTAWVYSPHGGNFLKTMLRLMAERGEVRVVADQIGTPTSATTLAEALWGLCGAGAQGIHHHTDAGVASWYDFAQAIGEDGHAAGLLERAPRVLPIRTEDYPTPARRPAFSVLDKTSTWAILGRPSPHWRCALRAVLRRLASAP
ncbi:MAG TPA: dTDP-4-dehydrorhamnose reductase [Caulobacteraceae bacterium]|nr:dTDP-4-dehydrorhamnose reductase [Caulobacteraceae bacterium]